MRLTPLFILLTLIACGDKTPAKKFISVRSLIDQQVQHIDTSLYSIKRYSTIDTLPPDTAYIAREDFRKEVDVFYQIPDLSDARLAKKFKEETRYDEVMERVIISYVPIKPEEESFQRIELFVKPDLAAGDQVKTILATRSRNDRNGSEKEELVWQLDRSCTSIRTTKKPATPEVTRITKWSWID